MVSSKCQGRLSYPLQSTGAAASVGRWAGSKIFPEGGGKAAVLFIAYRNGDRLYRKIGGLQKHFRLLHPYPNLIIMYSMKKYCSESIVEPARAKTHQVILPAHFREQVNSDMLPIMFVQIGFNLEQGFSF